MMNKNNTKLISANARKIIDRINNKGGFLTSFFQGFNQLYAKQYVPYSVQIQEGDILDAYYY